MSKDYIPDFIPDSYLSEMQDSDEETERKELAKQLLEFEKIKLMRTIYNAPKVQKSLPLRKVKFKKEIDENEEEEYQQKQKQKQN